MTATPQWVTKLQNQSRLSFGLAVTEMAEHDRSVVAISADTIDLIGLRTLAQTHPDQFVETGIAEQNAMGIASGLAAVGLRPYLCGYAPFISARSMEQLRNDVAYANQRVVIGAACSGISLAISGGTHHAVEDIAVMRNMPNMTVLVPADAIEAWQLTRATEGLDGAAYVRLSGRHEEKAVAAVDATPQIGRADLMCEGSDVTVIACGTMVAEALEAARALAERNVSVRVLNMHTIKPLDERAVLAAASETGAIVTAEEHRLSGGLGSAVAELLAREQPTRMRFVGMPDEFAIVGSTTAVRQRYGMCADNIAAQCLDLLELVD